MRERDGERDGQGEMESKERKWVILPSRRKGWIKR